MNNWNRFLFLLRKNLKTKFRNRHEFVCQFLVIIFCVTLTSVNTRGEPAFKELDKVDIHTLDDLFDIELLKKRLKPGVTISTWGLGYTPPNPIFTELITNAGKLLNITNIIPFTSRESLEQRMKNDPLIAGIEFPYNEKDIKRTPTILATNIRFPSNFRTFRSQTVRQDTWLTHEGNNLDKEWEKIDSNIKDMYVIEGFLQIQNALFVAYFNMIASSLNVIVKVPEITINSYDRHLGTSYSVNLANVSNMNGLIFYFLFLIPCINLIVEIIREKKANIMVQFTLYGFPHWVHWVAHFVASLLVFILLDIAIIGILKTKWFHGPMRVESTMALILFLILHNIALIMFSFMIANICYSLRTAVYVTLIAWVLMYSILSIILHSSPELRLYVVLGSLLFFNNIFTYGMRVLLRINTNFHNLFSQGWEVFSIFGVLAIDAVLYFLMAYLFDRLIPLPYIENKPLRCVNIFCRRKLHTHFELKSSAATVITYDGDYNNSQFEYRRSVEVIRCRNVCKYSKGKVILRDISLKFYENKITVLLGHNGSGKTTLLCIFAGLKSPSEGDVKIYGQLPRKVSENIFFLPQSNVLFHRLTVNEHLIYVMTAKKVNPVLKKFELLKWTRLLKSILNSKTVVADMNYEEKRLLCLALALCGETKIILLDEPTMNMTVEGRKAFWDMVRSHKKGRSIVVATNSVTEADYVGDRFAIMDHGTVVASGTAFALKMKFAASYYLICLKKFNCDTVKLTQRIEKYVPTAEIKNDTITQVIYIISMEHVRLFPNLLQDLEKNLAELGLESVDIMGSQLSDAYVNLSQERDIQKLYNRGNSIMDQISLLSGYRLLQNQVRALLLKKFWLQQPDTIPTVMMIVSIIIIAVMIETSQLMDTKHILQKQIEIGFNVKYSSDDIFEKLLTENNNKLHPIVEIDQEVYEGSDSRIYTWEPDICKVLLVEHDVAKSSSTAAIQLPDEDFKSAKLWFNERKFHTVPLALNLLHNALLRMAFKTPLYAVCVTNKPLRIDIETKFRFLQESKEHLKLSLVIGSLMPFMISSFIIFLINDRVSHVRSLEFVAGVRIYIYWLVPLLFDVLKIILFNSLFMFLFLFLIVGRYRIYEKLAILFTINIYGFAGLCETYFMSFYYIKTNRAFLACSLIHFVTGLFAYTIYWVSLEDATIVWWIGMFSPDFAVLDGLSAIHLVNDFMDLCHEERKIMGITRKRICSMYSFCCQKTVFQNTHPGVLPSIYFLLSTGFSFLFIILAKEYYAYERRFNSRHVDFLRSSYGPHNLQVVLNEKQRINKMAASEVSQYNMVVDQLEDDIPQWGNVLKTISFAVRSHECLVILVEKNYSTKHLMLKLIGEEGFSFGDIYVRGIDMKENLNAVRAFLGFCPKESTLLAQCTGYQLMEIMCLIRGVHSNMVGAIVHELIMLLEMHTFIHTKTSFLSVNERRRISIAIAFIAKVDIILIDLPTSGLSALPRKLIWNVLRYAKFIGKSVIFTTTDSWECEALADKILLYSGGEMIFYGPLQTLRSSFSTGIIFEVKVSRTGTTTAEIKENLLDDISNIRKFITVLSEESQLRSYEDGILVFFIPIKSNWSQLFDLIEQNRERLHIEEYIVSQTSFEDIFNNLMEKRAIAHIGAFW